MGCFKNQDVAPPPFWWVCFGWFFFPQKNAARFVPDLLQGIIRCAELLVSWVSTAGWAQGIFFWQPKKMGGGGTKTGSFWKNVCMYIIYMYTYIYIYMFIYLFIYLFIFYFFIYLFIHLSIYLFIYLLFLHLFIYLFIYLFVHLFIHLFVQYVHTICMYTACIYIYTYIYIHMYLHYTYIYIYIHRFSLLLSQTSNIAKCSISTACMIQVFVQKKRQHHLLIFLEKNMVSKSCSFGWFLLGITRFAWDLNGKFRQWKSSHESLPRVIGTKSRQYCSWKKSGEPVDMVQIPFFIGFYTTQVVLPSTVCLVWGKTF